MNLQMPLTLRLKDGATFDSYFPGFNSEVLSYLERLTGSAWEPAIYLWGTSGVGKSHLLQAVCHAAGARGVSAVYLPMAAADQFPCDALEGMENLNMVCIDDIHAIAGRPDWELAVRNLFERIQESGGGLVVAGETIPTELGLRLPQLVSRLAGGLVLQLKLLSEQDRLLAVQLRAKRRGLKLAVDAGRYLVRRCGQDTQKLFATLEALDQASLAAQRKLTIPFIRQVLKSTEPTLL